MAVAHKDTEEVLNLILLYLPSAPARQLLGDLQRSKAALHNASLRETIERLIVALERRGPTNYVVPQQSKEPWR